LSGFGKKDKFQERLDRIAAERTGVTEITTTPIQSPRPKSRQPAKPQRRFGAFAIMGTLALTLVGGGVYAGAKLRMSFDVPLGQMGRDLITNAVARTPSIDTNDGLLTSGPKERKLSDTGWELPSPYVAAPGRSDLTLATVAVMSAPTEGFSTNQTEVTSFPLNTSCTLRRPRVDEVVRNVRFGDTAQYTHTHVFSKSELATAVERRIDGLLSHAKHYNNAATAKGRMGQIDVYVTDTSAPVYLVLQTFNHDVLWNIHLGDGVTLSHVAMIGNKSGFAAPEGDFTFEALRIEDFVEEDTFYRNEKLRPCMIAPWRSAEGDWPLLQKLDAGLDASTYKGQLRMITQGHGAFNDWYTGQLGVDADVNLTSALKAAHALAGPVPTQPVQHEPITGRRLYIAENDFVAFGNAQLDAHHNDLLLAATGGNLSILNPDPMEVPTP
jgi:hypothetical protein